MLRAARASRKISQVDLARRLNVGQQAVSTWERGLARPESLTVARRIARIFPEHPEIKWVTAAGYPSGRKSSVVIEAERMTAPVRPLLELLPLRDLSPEQLQEFCATLLRATHPNVDVHQFGVHGDAQEGIDVEVRHKTGRLETFQCKRESHFGPEKVKKAVAAHTMKCDLAVIFLSREATAQARQEIRKRRKKRWELWDARDISRRVRELPPLAALRLVETFFPRHRKDFLGVDDPSVLQTSEQYYAPLLRHDAPFSHVWTLVGRDNEKRSVLEQLNKAAGDVTVLVGAGGLGKTRLVRAIVDLYAITHRTCAIAFLAASQAPTPRDFEQLRHQPSILLIIEDAHERDDLRAILHAAASIPARPRLLLTTRPYALQSVRGEALSAGYPISDDAITTLKGLSVKDAELIAKEILSDRRGPAHVAGDIARVTYDSPLATVVGSYLVATKLIHPRVLNNVETFRATLFDRFRDAVTGQVGVTADRDLLRDTLDLAALVQPFDPDAPSFVALATHVLSHSADKIRRAVELLREGGVLVRRGRNHRIVPDLLADYVLEQRCVIRETKSSTGFAESALKHADAGLVARIAVNVSKLDWRLSADDHLPSRVIGAVWHELELLCTSGTFDGGTVLEGVATAAYFQPAHGLALFDKLAPEATNTAQTRLLKHVAMNMEFLNEACERLWELGKNDERQLHRFPEHAVRILSELAAIEPTKPIEFSRAVVDFVLARLKSATNATTQQGLFQILESALATDGHTTETQGLTVTFYRFALRRTAVAEVRRVIIDFLFDALTSQHVSVAWRAAKSLEQALRYPMHGEQRSEWTKEFVETLERVKTLVQQHNLSPVVLVEIYKSINWHVKTAEVETRTAARGVVDGLPTTLPYRLTLALVDGWGHLEMSSESIDTYREKWTEHQRETARILMAEAGTAEDAVQIVREHLAAIEVVQSRDVSPQFFVRQLTELFPATAAVVCEEVLKQHTDPLASVFSDALFVLARSNAPKALEVAHAALLDGRVELDRSVAWAYYARARNGMPLSADEEKLIGSLLKHSDDTTVGSALRAIATCAGRAPQHTLARMVDAQIGRSRELAGEFCEIIVHQREFPKTLFTRDIVEAIFEKLLPCPSLDDHWIGEFLVIAAEQCPESVVRFFIARVDAAELKSYSEYEPLPYSLGERHQPKFRDSPSFAANLKTVREWLLQADDRSEVAHWGPKVYSLIAGNIDDLVISDLDEWVNSGARKKLLVVGRILSEASREFVFNHSEFVAELLDRAAAIDQDCVDSLESALWGAVHSGIYGGTPGHPFPKDIMQRDLSSEILKLLPRRSPAWKFFDGLRAEAEHGIRRKQVEEEELLDE